MTTQIFVGGINNYNKEELESTLSLVGPVINVDIKQDGSNTKGFGFCEYGNTEIAASGLRNLKNIEYNGKQLTINVPTNFKDLVLSPEENLMKNDISYIRETKTSINPSNGNSFKNTLLNLSDEQKFLLLYSMKTLSNKDSENFKKLLLKQNDETLNCILSLQNAVAAATSPPLPAPTTITSY